MVDQNVVDREFCLEAIRRGLVTQAALTPFTERKRADPSCSLFKLLLEAGVVPPAVATEILQVALLRAKSAASAAAPPPASQPVPPKTLPPPNGQVGSGRHNVVPKTAKQTTPGTSTTGRLNTGARGTGTPVSLQLPQSTIFELDAPAPVKPAPPEAKPVSQTEATYMDIEIPGRTMIAEPFHAPGDPAPPDPNEPQRTMIADDDLERPDPSEPQRTMIADDDLEPHAPPPEDAHHGKTPSDDGLRTMLLEGDDRPFHPPPGVPVDKTPAPAELKRAIAQQPRTDRRGPRDMEGPKIVVGGYFGDYEVLSTLGEGAMGQVFRAKRRTDGMPIALKVMRGGLVANPKVRERFLREAKAAKLIEHPNVVRFIDAGMIGNDQFLAMEFVEGRSLQALLAELKGLPLAFDRASQIFRQICAGLFAAHEAGVIHRDLKPENILLTRDGEVPKITDFGLARREEESMLLTRPGQVMGSPYYMAPEQGMGLAVDHRADIYSLGNIIFCMFTGRVPFPYASATEVIHAHCQAERPDPREVNPEVPTGLAAFILRMLAKNPIDRPQTARQALEEFEDVFRKELQGTRAAEDLPEQRPEPDSRDDDFDPGARVVDALPPGTRVGSLTIRSVIGAGGMGAVYAAIHDGGRTSALKVLPPQFASDPKRARAFLREGELGAKVKHPNVVETREYGHDPALGVAYIELELVEGTNLENLIKTGVMQDEALLVNIARGVAQALEAVHVAGIIHRDVKPANVLLAGDFLSRRDAGVKLIDFGLAIEKKDVKTAGESEFAGTPAYMAPEQLTKEGHVDERSDLYSVGATLYHAACAVVPFEGKTTAAIAYQHQRAKAKPPREHNESLSEAFQILIQLLLGKLPEERFQSATELVTELSKTTPEGKLAKPQVHAKYRTNRMGNTGKFKVESQTEPPKPPPRAAIIAAAGVLVLCALVFAVKIVGAMMRQSGATVEPTPAANPVDQPSAAPTDAPAPTPTPRRLDTLSEREKHSWREKMVKDIEDLVNAQKFLEARRLADKAVREDGTLENRILKFRRELEGTEHAFDEDFSEARRQALLKNWKEAEDKLDEAALFISRDDDQERLDKLRAEVADMKKRHSR
jgi:serine/threonine protein kinase